MDLQRPKKIVWSLIGSSMSHSNTVYEVIQIPNWYDFMRLWFSFENSSWLLWDFQPTFLRNQLSILLTPMPHDFEMSFRSIHLKFGKVGADWFCPLFKRALAMWQRCPARPPSSVKFYRIDGRAMPYRLHGKFKCMIIFFIRINEIMSNWN